VADVNVEPDEHVQIIRINRPAVRNALNASVALGIAAAIDDANASSEIRVSVITGDADAFSSGTDLKALVEGETTEIEGRGLCGIGCSPPSRGGRSAPASNCCSAVT
jgi:enoyl-CoA hydratase